MFKKILVPLDGSEIAAKVLPKVVELAKAFKAKVTLCHVCYSGVGAMVGEATPGVIKAAEAQEQKFCETFLAKAGKDLKDQGLDVGLGLRRWGAGPTDHCLRPGQGL